MKFLLDTDTFSEIARLRRPGLAQRLADQSLSEMAVSAITVGEIRFGFAATPPSPLLQSRTESLLADVVCLPLNADVAASYGLLRAHLRRLGMPTGSNDHWIAAHALSANLTLVTNNTREFERVPGLRVENWLR
jgi:tRNA(fMet)-specific endonuclease VapC